MFYANKGTAQTKMVRSESLDGLNYLVFPVVMMVEGVHVGSAGPTFYSANKLAEHPDAWNAKPIVVYHPDKNGVPVSACSKEILEKQSVGIILNAEFVENKLRAEAWINESKADKVFPGILAMLRSGSIMEVSIGHFTEDVEESGVWNNESYERRVTVIKPDHLALLPTEIGACSVQDGAGIPRINKDMRVNQDVSHDEIRCLLYDALANAGVGRADVYLDAVYDDYIIYGIYDSEKLWKRTYTMNNNTVELGQAEEVRRLIEYVTVNHKKETKSMDDKMKELLLNKGFSEKSLETLSSLPDTELEVLSQAFAEPVKQEPIVNVSQVAQNMTVNEYLQHVPEQFREVLTNGQRLLDARKADLVGKIVANKRNQFSRETLNMKPIEELEGIAALAVEPDYALAGSLTANQDTPIVEEAMPEISFGGKEM